MPTQLRQNRQITTWSDSQMLCILPKKKGTWSISKTRGGLWAVVCSMGLLVRRTTGRSRHLLLRSHPSPRKRTRKFHVIGQLDLGILTRASCRTCRYLLREGKIDREQLASSNLGPLFSRVLSAPRILRPKSTNPTNSEPKVSSEQWAGVSSAMATGAAFKITSAIKWIDPRQLQHSSRNSAEAP